MSIRISELNKFYGSTQVLHNINLECSSGDVLTILGPSGAGKSTLIRILNLLEKGSSGCLQVADESFDFNRPITDQAILKLRRKVGMVFQQYNLWPHKTVMGNLIAAPMKVNGLSKKEATAQAMVLLESLHLPDKHKTWPGQLSGGQQQRVAIARALMMKPEVLLFDEPTAALDPEITNQIVTIINDLKQTNITQIIVTHELGFAKKIATHAMYLEGGQVMEYGTHEMFSQPVTDEFSQYLTH